MSQYYTICFHNGWYDTQFSMPFMVQQPCHYHTFPHSILPYSTWINSPQMLQRLPLANKLQAPAPNTSPLLAQKPAAALPMRRALRSILKRPRPSQPQKKKFVRFTPSTASPPTAVPGTYKHAGKPKSPKARHPARAHACLSNTPQQRTHNAMKAVQGPLSTTPPQLSKPAPSSSNRVQQRPTERFSRPPTPPPAEFFRSTGKAQSTAQRPPQQSNTLAPRQPAPQQVSMRLAPKQTPACDIYCSGPYHSDSEDSNTDAGLAETLNKMKQMDVKQADVKVSKAEIDAAAIRGRLQALAKDFDRKNAWRKVGR